MRLYLHPGEEIADPDFDLNEVTPLARADSGWKFDVVGTGFEGTFGIEIEEVPP
jgi:hypothetical protein